MAVILAAAQRPPAEPHALFSRRLIPLLARRCRTTPTVPHTGSVARGTVKFWKNDKGWGAIMSDVLPTGSDAWAHFSVIEGDGFRELHAGDIVDFDYESARQDSFDYRATRVVRIGSGPAPRLQRREDGTVEALPPES